MTDHNTPTPRTDNTDHWRVDRDEADLTYTDAVSADFARELERENARLREALSKIKWVKDCGIDSVNDKGELVNYPADERDAMYDIARKALETK